MNISSKDNQRIKDLIRLRDDAKFRSDKSLFYVEGERIIKDTPIEIIDSLYVHEDFEKNFSYITSKVSSDMVYTLSSQVYDKVKDTNNSQGIIAIVKMSHKNIISGDYILALDEIKDPGNLGTIIRLSEACGINTVLMSEGCCDIYNTKVTRASMSSIFRTNVYKSHDIVSDLYKLKNDGYKIYTTGLRSDTLNYREVDYTGKIVIVIGNEANGVRDAIYEISDKIVKIPMKGMIESLNASIATSIICYEAMNKRCV